jgi:perosamine synthetase
VIPVSRPHLWGEERVNIEAALAANEISSMGSFLEPFERGFAAYCGARYGVACMNGTVACHLAFAAAGISPGDEVICPSFTMMSPVFSLLYLGAVPRFVDAEPDTWNLDVSRVEALITPRTRAVLAVHIYGHPCEMDALRALCARRGLLLLEDAAEAHGGEVRGKKTGALGDVAAFSFYANKIITTGEGGMVLTSDPVIEERLRSLRNLSFGKDPWTRFRHQGIGFQYRMTNLQAAMGVAQLGHIDEAVTAKRAIAAKYNALLAQVPGLTLPVEKDWAKNVYWVYGVLVEDAFGISRLELQKRLVEEGVETRTFFYPAHLQPMFAGAPAAELPVSVRLWERGLYLPSFVGMGDDAIAAVVDAISRVRARPG